MNTIQRLIEQLCPNGVKFIRLGDYIKILRGKRITTRDIVDDGQFPVYHGGIIPIGKYDKKNRDANSTMIINVGASAGTIGYSEVDFWSSDGCFCIEQSDLFNDRFLYHLMLTKEKYIQSKVRKAGIPTLDNKIVENLILPVPPLEVQREIVHILDNFMLLSAELSAELKARQKQYEYYRDHLFDFDNNVKYMPLKDICYSIKDGLHNLPQNSLNSGEYPILSAQNIIYGRIDYTGKRYVDEQTFLKEKKRINLEKGDVLLTIVATIGRTAVLEENNNFLLQRSVCSLKPKEIINPYYLKFYLDTYKAQDYMITNAHGSAQAGLYIKQVAEILIPIPTIEQQNKIVQILLNFDKITNDISEGLPAEIEARKKQYEYYRDKLLTFKELVNEGEYE